MAEGLNRYETIFVVSAKLGDDGNAALVERFKDRIARHGTVESVDEWGKRRLAYLINKEAEGYYTLINFESAPDFVAELDRRYQITDGILRSVIIKKDPRHEAAEKAAKERRDAEAANAAANSVDVEAIAAEAILDDKSDKEDEAAVILNAEENEADSKEVQADVINSLVDVAEEETESVDAEEDAAAEATEE